MSFVCCGLSFPIIPAQMFWLFFTSEERSEFGSAVVGGRSSRIIPLTEEENPGLTSGISSENRKVGEVAAYKVNLTCSR